MEKELAGDKDQELMADKASKLPAEEDPDEIWPEHLPRPPPLDPYLLGVAEEAPSDEDEEKPSKRAMQRALQGFSRKSGGWKHKKRGSGKSPLGKGRGKNCRYCANSFHQVTVVFWNSVPALSCHVIICGRDVSQDLVWVFCFPSLSSHVGRSTSWC